MYIAVYVYLLPSTTIYCYICNPGYSASVRPTRSGGERGRARGRWGMRGRSPPRSTSTIKGW